MEVAGTHVLTWAAFVYATNTKAGLLEQEPQRWFRGMDEFVSMGGG